MFLRSCHFPDEEMGVQKGWLEADSNLVYQLQSQGSKAPEIVERGRGSLGGGGKGWLP